MRMKKRVKQVSNNQKDTITDLRMRSIFFVRFTIKRHFCYTLQARNKDFLCRCYINIFAEKYKRFLLNLV